MQNNENKRFNVDFSLQTKDNNAKAEANISTNNEQTTNNASKLDTDLKPIVQKTKRRSK